MKLRWWYALALNMILAALVISGAVFYVVHFRGGFDAGKNGRTLEIRDSASGKVYGRWSLDETGEFAVEFVHSVNQSPVRETYKADGKKILPVSVRFYSFGAGMRSDLDEGQTLSRDGDAMVISGFSQSFPELNYIVGTVSDHLLLVNGETVSLRDLCGRNAHITLRVR